MLDDYGVLDFLDIFYGPPQMNRPIWPIYSSPKGHHQQTIVKKTLLSKVGNPSRVMNDSSGES